MIYSLPNGKVIYLSIEQYLDMTDQDIQFLMSINAGEYSKGPWQGSSIRKPKKVVEEEEEIDTSIDYQYEDEDKIISNEIPLEEVINEVLEIPEEE